MDPQTAAAPDPRRWRTLAVLALAQFMVVLDVTIVNVALPDIQQHLDFSTGGLQWVINAYTLMFGGFLLLGGRAGDLLGRRRVFLAGLTLFASASLVAGLAPSSGVLVAARAAQGLGGALLSPAALSIVTVTFAHGRERNIAMGVWGGLAGLGGTLGVVAGGILVDALGWESIFMVNVPIAIAVGLITPRFVRESKAGDVGGGFDVAGALLGTGGVLALVYGVIRTGALGWGAGEVLTWFAVAAVLLVAFVAVEARARAPLVPLRLFSSRGLNTSSVALALNGSVFLAMFFLTALFLQSVRGDSALTAGLQFVPMGIAAILAAVVGSQLVTRIGTRPVFVTGALLSALGLWLLTSASATGAYATELLPGFVVFGLGMPLVGVPNQISAVMDVRHHDAGAASGLVTAAFQIGGALGLAVITTLANARVTDAVAGGAAQSSALTDGFHLGLTVAAVLALANLGLALVLAPADRPDETRVTEALGAA